MDQHFGKTLIGIGLMLIGIGALWSLASRLGLGRLPGDISIKREGFSFYFPLATCLLLSLILSALAWLFGRFK